MKKKKFKIKPINVAKMSGDDRIQNPLFKSSSSSLASKLKTIHDRQLEIAKDSWYYKIVEAVEVINDPACIDLLASAKPVDAISPKLVKELEASSSKAGELFNAYAEKFKPTKFIPKVRQ